jgi:hypothetical protein
MGIAPIEAIAMVRLIRYQKKIEQMEYGRWPKVIFNDILCKRKKTWMQQNIKWLSKWDIHLNMCPTNNKEIKDFVIDRFHKRTWDKGLGRKKEYYIEEFNRTYNHHQKNIHRGPYILESQNAYCPIVKFISSCESHSPGGWLRP